MKNASELVALQTAASLFMYTSLDRVKTWEKYKGPLLFSQVSRGVNLLIMATGECFAMLCFCLWLRFMTFHDLAFSTLLVYAYISLTITKATAEAVTKHLEGNLSLGFGLRIALACHAAVMVIVIFLIPIVPQIGLLLHLWAFVGMFFTVSKNFVSEEPSG